MSIVQDHCLSRIPYPVQNLGRGLDGSNPSMRTESDASVTLIRSASNRIRLYMLLPSQHIKPTNPSSPKYRQWPSSAHDIAKSASLSSLLEGATDRGPKCAFVERYSALR